MKHTAMQQLIKSMKVWHNRMGGMDKSRLLIEQLIKEATELLEVEKQQIIDAFDKGGDNALQIGEPDFIDGPDYFTNTFTQ
jgi:hypothetical protein